MYKKACIIFFVTLAYYCHGQFNIKVGYNAMFPIIDKTNEIFSRFNQQPNVILQYEKFRFMHGLDLGFRYFISNGLAGEIGYTNNLSGDNKSTIKVGTISKNDEWRLSNKNLILGLESYFGWVGLGGHIVRSSWAYSKDIEGLSKKQSILKESDYQLKINVFIYAQSDKTAFALKPYYSFPINGSGKNIDEVEKTLNGTSTGNQFEQFKNFGLSMVFYNGPQRN